MRNSSRKENKVYITALLASCAVVFLSVRCKKQEQKSTGIAEQSGITYAPLQIMKEKGFLERRLPDMQISWKQFDGPTGIREGVLSGEIDFGFMGVSPVLVGIDNGTKWCYTAGLSSSEVVIITSRQEVRSLRGMTEENRIAILPPTYTQHVLLCTLTEEQLGNARALDSQLVSMSHPDSVSALLSGTKTTAHVSASLYISQEVDGGRAVVATGEDVMGEPFTSISCVAMGDLYKDHRDHYNTFQGALKESVDFINENPQESVRLLAPVYGITQGELSHRIGYHRTIYSTDLNDVARFSQRMAETGFINQARPIDELIFDNVVYR